METLLREYFPILVFLAIAGAISIAMVAASFIVARQRPNTEKLSPYECGFDPFGDARVRFDVRYYLVAIPVHHLRSRSGLPVSVGGRSAILGRLAFGR